MTNGFQYHWLKDFSGGCSFQSMHIISYKSCDYVYTPYGWSVIIVMKRNKHTTVFNHFIHINNINQPKKINAFGKKMIWTKVQEACNDHILLRIIYTLGPFNTFQIERKKWWKIKEQRNRCNFNGIKMPVLNQYRYFFTIYLFICAYLDLHLLHTVNCPIEYGKCKKK